MALIQLKMIPLIENRDWGFDWCNPARSYDKILFSSTRKISPEAKLAFRLIKIDSGRKSGNRLTASASTNMNLKIWFFMDVIQPFIMASMEFEIPPRINTHGNLWHVKLLMFQM